MITNNSFIQLTCVLTIIHRAISSCPYIQYSFTSDTDENFRYPINLCVTSSTSNPYKVSSSMYVCNPDLKSVNISYYDGPQCIAPYLKETKPFPSSPIYTNVEIDCGAQQQAQPCNYRKDREYTSTDCSKSNDYKEVGVSLKVCQGGNYVWSCYSNDEEINYVYSETGCKGNITGKYYEKTGCDPLTNQLIIRECNNQTSSL